MATAKKTASPPKKMSGPARRLDARPDRLDFRDLPYRAPLRSLPPCYPLEEGIRRFIASYVAEGLVLNQGNQGACTGFGLACVANYLFWTRHVQSKTRQAFVPVSPRMLYELAKRYDEWPGVDYDGSSCRGALKGWHKHGVCSFDAWPYKLDSHGDPVFVRPGADWPLDASRRPLGVYYRIDRGSIVDLQSAISEIGAIYVSAGAHDGWDALAHARSKKAPPMQHSDLPAIVPVSDKKSIGGHAFALVGYNDRGFIVQNSWGPNWGASGFAVLPYDDWVVNATDAWACALGVPASLRDGPRADARPIVSTRWRVGAGKSLTSLDRNTREPDNPADDPWPIDHPFNFKPYQPWSTDAAYQHTLVTGNDGELSVTDFTRDASDKAGLAAEIIRRAPQKWLASQAGKTLKLAIYAHGGLNTEDESIKRIRVLGPCFQANDVYPIFLTWKTGAGEILGDMAQDWARRLFGEEAARSKGILDLLGDAKDRAIEALAYVLGRGLWTEMRDNAASSVQPGHGLDLLLKNLLDLQADLQAAGKTLELHLAGHSAGSILLGHFLAQLAQSGAPQQHPLKIKTTTLFAAACSSGFANRNYAAAANLGVLDLSKLWLYVLSDDNEKADALPSPSLPAYGKSLLYLVSRALDDVRKMPLLGMERALQTAYATNDEQWDARELAEVQLWQSTWPGTQDTKLLRTVDEPEIVTTRQMDHAKATHASFDNNIKAMTETIARIKGGAVVADLEWLDY